MAEQQPDASGALAPIVMSEEEIRRAAAEPDPFVKYGVEPRAGVGTLSDMMGPEAARAYIKDQKETREALYLMAVKRFGHIPISGQIQGRPRP